MLYHFISINIELNVGIGKWKMDACTAVDLVLFFLQLLNINVFFPKNRSMRKTNQRKNADVLEKVVGHDFIFVELIDVQNPFILGMNRNAIRMWLD